MSVSSTQLNSIRKMSRQRIHSPFWAVRLKQFIIPVAGVAVMLQLLFLANMSYLYGALFNSNSRAHALKILALDYDGGEIGSALSTAYQSLKGNQFPTLEYGSISDYPTQDSIRDAVCKEGYWAVVYTHRDASDNLMAALGGNNTQYDPRSTISFIYDGIFYPVISLSMIQGNMQTLIAAASRIFYNVAPKAVATVDLTNPTSAAAFLNPIQASSITIAPTNQGTRVLLNTVSMVMPVLMQFFFSMAFNGIFAANGVFAKMSKRDVYIVRFVISHIYTLLSALAMTGYIWAYREDWSVSGGQFAETWMCLWFYMHINYLVVDTILESIIPLQFFAFFMLTWIIINIASTIFPFELSPGFYRWGYALPAHNAWRLLMDIWGDGCKRQLEVALPVLFTWWVLGHMGSAWSVRMRCVKAQDGTEEKHIDLDEFVGDSGDSITPSREQVLSRLSSQRTRRVDDFDGPEQYSKDPSRDPERLAEGSESRTILGTGREQTSKV